MRTGGDRFLPPERSRAIREQIESCRPGAVRPSAALLANGRRERAQRILRRVPGRVARGGATAGARLVGEMMVTVGSRRIDASIRGRRARLRNAMREVG